MLSAAFFFSVFASVIWVFYALNGQGGDGINDFTVMTVVIVLPIFILWTIFGYIYQYVSASVLNKNMYSLFKQMKKNQDYSDLIAKAMLEAEQNLRDNIVLSKFDIFIADMNELLSEIMLRSQLIGSEKADNLWIKVKNGGKWAFGKALIEQNQMRPLADMLLQKSLRDAVLGGSILEFCSRYQTLVSSLEKHDKERIFLNVVETGVFGKVFSLLAVPADSIRQNRDLTLTRVQMSEPEEPEITQAKKELLSPQISVPEENLKVSDNGGLSESARRLFVNTFTRRKKTEPEQDKEEIEKDPLSVAFAKSFGAEEDVLSAPSLQENTRFAEEEIAEPSAESMPEIIIDNNIEEETQPHFDITASDEKTEPAAPFAEPNAPGFNEPTPPSFGEPFFSSSAVAEPEPAVSEAPAVLSWQDGFSDTGKRLEDIRQEVENVKMRDLRINNSSAEDEGMPEPKVGNDTDYSYPFGGWTNADNYNK